MKIFVRVGVLAGTATAALAGLWSVCGPGVSHVASAVHDRRLGSGQTLDPLVADLAACVAMAAAVAVACLAALTVAAELLRRTRSPRPGDVPPSLGRFRRGVLALCGLAVAVAAPAAPSWGAESGTPPACADRCDLRLDGLPMPELPVTGAPRDHVADRRPGHVVVRPGDSLWAIAAGISGNADDAETARVVARLIELNAGALHGNPDLIFPGTHLTTPGGDR